MPDLIYPGTTMQYEVGPRRDVVYPDLSTDVETPEDPDSAEFWGVYVRPRVKGIATWVADFQHETDAREYAAWQAKRT